MRSQAVENRYQDLGGLARKRFILSGISATGSNKREPSGIHPRGCTLCSSAYAAPVLVVTRFPTPVQVAQNVAEHSVRQRKCRIELQRVPRGPLRLWNDLARGERPDLQELELRLPQRRVRRREIRLLRDSLIEIRGTRPEARSVLSLSRARWSWSCSTLVEVEQSA